MIAKPKKKINYKERAINLHSKWIRRRGICEFHQKIQEKRLIPPCSCNGVLQDCHKITRKNAALFFDVRNNFCGCAGSNAWAHFNQPHWDSLWRLLWPEDQEYLESRKGIRVQRRNWDYKIIADEYKKKLEELEK